MLKNMQCAMCVLCSDRNTTRAFDVTMIGKGHSYGVAGRGLGASGKTPAGSTEEKAEPAAIPVVVVVVVRGGKSV